MPHESFIYFDYAATSPLRDGVLDAMMPFLQNTFGNPSSIHRAGRMAASAIAKARADIANFFSVNPRNIIFTGCGTEADNQAIATLAAFGKTRNKDHIIVIAIDHHAVLEYAHYLEDLGYNVTYLPPRKNGVVSLEDVKAAITEKTCGISIMTVNNETGI
ncbi:MAG: aminotransferase class V-fold PLP-dependent enzyme, partial [Eggerthellaceae bacterium]|nr:aminotransferase class V-fold PLP-dependent enzyme [Eggerthellaceae bacterium]